MSYTNPSQTADYTLSEGTLVGSTIANSTAATGDVYAKNLTVDNAAVVVSNATIDADGYINATAGANFKDMTVLSGGTFNRTAGVYLSGLTAASGAVLNNVLGGAIKWQGTWNIQSGAKIGGVSDIYTDTDGYLNMNGRGMAGAIYCYINVKNININSYLYLYGHVSGGTVASRSDNGDALRMYGNAYAEDIHVLSGGSVRFYGASATLRDMVADSGAKITLTANNWLAGRKTTFAKGFISDSNLGNVYAQDGVIYNWTTPGNFGAFYFADITLADGDATGQYLYLGTGAETRNFTVTGAAGKLTGIVLCQAGNGTAIDTTATDAGGGITVQSSWLGTFGGTNNNVTAGHIFLGPAAAAVANPDLSIIGDKFYGIELKTNTTKEYMTKIKLISGLSAVNPIVSSGGTLYLESGGSAVGGTVYEGGVLQALKGGTISGATVSGYLHVMDFNSASETASANRPAAFANDVDLLAGQLFLRGSNASGANLRVSGGIFYLQNGGSASKVTVTGGALSAYRNAGVHPDDTPTTIHLDDLTMTGGSTYLYHTVQATDATITGGSMNIRGTARVSGAVVTGGSVTMSGGVLSGATFRNTGKLTVSSGGSALDVTVNGGATYQLMIVSDGGYASNVTLIGEAGNTPSTNYVYTYGTGVIENITVDSGSLYLAGGGTVRNLTVRNSALPVARGSSAYISGATISGGYLHFQNGAKGQDVVVDGGELIIKNDFTGSLIGTGAYVSGVDIVKGTATISAGGGIYALRMSGGTLNISSTGKYDVPFISGAVVTGGTLNVYGGALLSGAIVRGGLLQAYGVASDVTISSGGTFSAYKNGDGTTAAGQKITVLAGGKAYAQTSNAKMSEVTVANGGMLYLWSATVDGADIAGSAVLWGGGKLNDVVVRDGANINVNNLAVVSNINATGGKVTVSNGGVIHAVEGAMLTNLQAKTGATIDYANGAHTSGAMIRGDQTNIAANTLVYSGAVLDATVVDGVMTNLGANGNYYRMRVGTDISVVGAVVGNGHRLYAHEDAEVVGGTINTGGNIGILGSAVGSKVRTYGSYNIFESGTAKDTIVEKGGVLRFNAAAAKATGTVVNSGGTIRFQNGIGGSIDDTTLKAGAALELYAGAETGDNLYLDFEGSTAAININNLALVDAETAIHMINIAAGNTYTIATAGDTTRTVNCEWSDYSNAIKAGESYTNAFTGIGYSFNAAGTAITTTAFDIGSAKATAGSVTTGDAALNTNDRAAKWDADTIYTDSVTVAGSGLAGDAWLEIDGTNVSTALYGAEGTFDHTVNIYAKSGKIRNLAAGAKAGGSVAGVMLTVEGDNTEFSGVAYAGGFGSVTGKADTYVAGGTFTKDFYAGALANKNVAKTTVGEVALSITGGTFKGNVYGASAVKTDTTVGNDLRNETGNVTVSVTDGTTDKDDFCLFAGGYATGNATGTVYTVGDIDVEIKGGTWVGDTVHGGRGVFGGVFASGVTAETQDVTITISGDAKVGNVFGGGWAQKGGVSIVDDVEINIEGGTVANVFGGGAHSVTAPGGSTVVDDVTINVTGGTITGSIYAMGQSADDLVIGDEISVVFSGDDDFSCGVYGYSYVGGAVGDATLSYTDYSGEFSGEIGGFADITFAKGTEMDLATAAASVSNGKWTFDFTDRDAELADTSFMTWDNADFANDTVKVNFTDATQAAAGWSIATAAFDATTTFTLAIGGTDVTSVAYDTAITDGDWTGWKFTDENGTLKFKQLA